MGYALRHVDDLVGTFLEFHRVLRPGGGVLTLEITRPTSRLNRADTIVEAMRAGGFDDTECVTRYDVCRSYTGRKSGRSKPDGNHRPSSLAPCASV